jgi:hypothetical protein
MTGFLGLGSLDAYFACFKERCCFAAVYNHYSSAALEDIMVNTYHNRVT